MTTEMTNLMLKYQTEYIIKISESIALPLFMVHDYVRLIIFYYHHHGCLFSHTETYTYRNSSIYMSELDYKATSDAENKKLIRR